MSGVEEDDRILNSLLTVLFLVEEEYSLSNGPFKIHVKRLVEFLNKISIDNLKESHRFSISSLLHLIKKGGNPTGNWKRLVVDYLVNNSLEKSVA